MGQTYSRRENTAVCFKETGSIERRIVDGRLDKGDENMNWLSLINAEVPNYDNFLNFWFRFIYRNRSAIRSHCAPLSASAHCTIAAIIIGIIPQKMHKANN